MLPAHLLRAARRMACVIALALTSGGYADDSTSDVAAWIGIRPESMVVAQFDVPQATAVLNALDESSELRGAIAAQHAQADAASEAVTALSESLQANPAAPDRDRVPLSARWITPELLHRTQQVWTRAYGRPIAPDEAVEILTNVRHLAELLRDAGRTEDRAS